MKFQYAANSFQSSGTDDIGRTGNNSITCARRNYISGLKLRRLFDYCKVVIVPIFHVYAPSLSRNLSFLVFVRHFKCSRKKSRRETKRINEPLEIIVN